VFTTFTLPKDGAVATQLQEVNRELIAALGLVRGVAHTEFIQSHTDEKIYFLECAARVGGAYINEMVEAATGLNLWREWARIEVAGGDASYRLPAVADEAAGVILTLARQEDPDTSSYTDPEIFMRIKKRHHAGFILRASDHQRIQALLTDYTRRFAEDFVAVKPPGDKPVD
jgi:biotin carboxylase